MTNEHRVAARGLLLTPTGRTLLLNTQLAWLGPVWMVPGGGVESGESLVEAATRELAEETGLIEASIGPELWWRNVTIRLPERTVHLKEHYFLVEVPEFEPKLDGLHDYERDERLGQRWWGAEEILNATDLFAPPELGVLVHEIVVSGVSPTREIQARNHAV